MEISSGGVQVEPYNKDSVFVHVSRDVSGLPAIVVLILEVPGHIFVTAEVALTCIL
jgi:hypothetical protein